MDELNCTCAHCGAGFSTSRNTKIYCSRKCNHAAWLLRNIEKHKAHREAERDKPQNYSRVSFNQCATCGVLFIASRKKKYCCDECKPKHKYEYVSIAPQVKACVLCGREYRPKKTGGRPHEFCSDECRELSNKALKRIDKARRKAVLRGATVEKVDPFVVFDRDKWTCQLCGRKTPQKMRGTYGDNAPELDHIVPLSKGGEHSYMNTQCSCRKCNGLKSGKPIGQTLLFG